jgi:hypothetical protein
VIACNSDGGAGGGMSTVPSGRLKAICICHGENTQTVLSIGTAGQILSVNSGATARRNGQARFRPNSMTARPSSQSATASKGTLKFDQTGISDTKLVTVKYTATDNVTFTPTVSSTSYGLGALNFATTGTISGKIPMITKSDDYVLGTDSAQEAYGYMVWMSGTRR